MGRGFTRTRKRFKEEELLRVLRDKAEVQKHFRFALSVLICVNLRESAADSVPGVFAAGEGQGGGVLQTNAAFHLLV